MKTLDYQLFYQRALPHYQPAGASIFITCRLAGSLPHEKIEQLEAEKRRLEKLLKSVNLDSEIVRNCQEELFDLYDLTLDCAGYDPQWLKLPEIAQLFCNAAHFLDEKSYELLAYCVMPNHIHLVCTPLVLDEIPIPVSKILHSLKSYTANQANRILGRTGDFWQHESYDHAIRSHDEMQRVVRYVLENPIRAGLSSQWTYTKYEM